jgi:hypothetical protein
MKAISPSVPDRMAFDRPVDEAADAAAAKARVRASARKRVLIARSLDGGAEVRLRRR